MTERPAIAVIFVGKSGWGAVRRLMVVACVGSLATALAMAANLLDSRVVICDLRFPAWR